jgi:hypothetical protein
MTKPEEYLGYAASTYGEMKKFVAPDVVSAHNGRNRLHVALSGSGADHLGLLVPGMFKMNHLILD